MSTQLKNILNIFCNENAYLLPHHLLPRVALPKATAATIAPGRARAEAAPKPR
jgi:hypothetical protein